MSEEASQIAEERRKVKGKVERERCTQPNAEFQRIERRGKKAFLNELCKQIEENNSMGKDQRSLQENRRYQRNISCKNRHDIGQKLYGPKRSRRD